MQKRIQQEEMVISKLINMKENKYGEYWGEEKNTNTIKIPAPY